MYVFIKEVTMLLSIRGVMRKGRRGRWAVNLNDPEINTLFTGVECAGPST